MFKNVALSKALIFSVFLMVFFITIYSMTKSIWFGVIAIAAFITVWVVFTNVRASLRGAELKKYMSLYGSDISFPNTDIYAQNYYFYGERVDAGGTAIIDEGIVFYSFGVCSSLISWSQVEKITKFSHKGIALARLTLCNGVNSSSKLSVPWREEFDDMLPVSQRKKMRVI